MLPPSARQYGTSQQLPFLYEVLSGWVGPSLPPPSIRPSLSFPLEKEKEENQSFFLFFHVNGPILYRKVFRAIHHVEKDQPPIVPFFYLEREVLLMMLRTAVRSARGKLGQNMTPEGPGARNPILSESEFTVPPALMLRDRNILLPSTAVTPEIKGSTRAPVLRRGGRTDRGLAPGVDRVKSAGIMQIHRPLPFSFG